MERGPLYNFLSMAARDGQWTLDECPRPIDRQDCSHITHFMSATLSVWLVHPESEMITAFRYRFAGLSHVEFHEQRFEDLAPHDCFVTAGNSFGIMTAGIDAAVVNYFGRSIMRDVQTRILADFLGEQPIGTAFVVPTHHPRVPFLVHAPTMRVPTSIDDTANIYSATWAAFLAIHAHNRDHVDKIQSVALPAFGTGFGQVSFDEAARQMAVAYSHYLRPPSTLDWDLVVARHKSICYDGNKRVVRQA